MQRAPYFEHRNNEFREIQTAAVGSATIALCSPPREVVV